MTYMTLHKMCPWHTHTNINGAENLQFTQKSTYPTHENAWEVS